MKTTPTKRYVYAGAVLLSLGCALGVGSRMLADTSNQRVMAPRFEVDPFWPKPLPNHWRIGMTIGVSVDAQDNVYIIHRPGSIEARELHLDSKLAQCCAKAPPVLKFDKEGNLIASWGGAGKGHPWMANEHGLTVDYKGNVWLGGNGGVGSDPEYKDVYVDNQILKFSPDGKFLFQIGKARESKGSNDPDNVKGSSQTLVDPKTNELYVADGYGNHRVVVYDAETGKYKRHWGAYGNRPDDAMVPAYNPDAPVSKQFDNPVHCVALSNDNLLYVCDRRNDRVQVFKPDGTFVKEYFHEKKTLGAGSTWEIAFSKDPQQKYLFLTDGENSKVNILLRETMEVLTSFGDGGRIPGEFYGVHSIALDSKGNMYTTETYQGQRIQKFVYKGLAPVTKKDQGVIWPAKKG